MSMRSSAEFRSWGALRPRAEGTPSKPLTGEEMVILRILAESDEAPASLFRILRSMGVADIDDSVLDAIERALAGLVARGLAVRIEDGWRRAL
jgi:hypothetical protein